ncbi:hypothetical protein PVAP13_3NG186521 [Panicum virgatum]|uniref:Uncharacterized protein n=1 Tax=Panicum virgatum TaxID=38727 RepID=A0A8T0U6F6_PANVG|nr:hypothetical protein PVAP13_3NG186521 [Panicum virgatum]
MVANLVGYIVGPSGIKVLISKMAGKEALPALAFIFTTFYMGQLMFHCEASREVMELEFMNSVLTHM